MNRFKTRLFAMLLTLCMVITLLPTAALALLEGVNQGEGGTIAANETAQAIVANNHSLPTNMPGPQISTGNLTVTKEVSGVGGDAEEVFEFTVTLSDKTINGK